MKVLITGGTGYVGSAVRRCLREIGHNVRLLVREGSEKKLNSSEGYDVVTGDILNSNSCLRACDGMDAVVHLVGIIREFPLEGITFEDLHVAATFNIADAARRMGAGRFVHMSALGSGENASSVYHRTKYAAEQVVRRSQLQWTIFRPSVIFEKGSEFIQTLTELVRRRYVPVIGGGKTFMQPIALSDVCTCMCHAVTMPETHSQVYELGGPEQITFREMIEAVASALGVRIRTASVPAWAVRPVVRLMERFPSFPLTSDQLAMLCEDNVCDIEPYTSTFGIHPVSFTHALPAIVE
ncbi:MAG: NAD(P)H-binding protein [Candidatus Latescibacteria bacterium]|nr:NAD(P)H-binding protein [Candidatus Latescibacterota bacterium]NIM22626.1 NAD(P)H-binding protein [Candidatus Latescibacterota bacterium]NIM64915.1 NAD(P)H-binding protein [Candidatus Latescibacterota bacterium]NIO01430.1 NAD(P)H-binding protein [Candidatus Latescibacterota bacterium]NIO27940.1 NAD(P)H-binding protein [Candidatus Latescibacterota bacterium]